MAGSFLGDSVRWQNGFARAWRLEYQGSAGRSHQAGDTSPPIGPGREGKLGLKKIYAVGLEMLCPGGAYAWAPKIPSADTLAGSMPSKCELVHNHAHSFQNGAGHRSRAPGTI